MHFGKSNKNKIFQGHRRIFVYKYEDISNANFTLVLWKLHYGTWNMIIWVESHIIANIE